MISYKPFWKTLEKSKENQYTLIKYYKLSASVIYRLKHNKNISTETIDKLCCILKCNVSDILEFYNDDFLGE